MNKLTLQLGGWLKRFKFIVAILLLGLLLPQVQANTTTVVAPANSTFTFISNPYSYANYDLQSDLGTFLSAAQPGDMVFVWDCSLQYWMPFIYEGAGVGTGLGYGSDWILDVDYPSTPLPAYAQDDSSDEVYWLDATAPSAPQLAPGVGFFYRNNNSTPENLVFNGTPVSAPSPQPCGCGSLNAAGNTYMTTADYQQITGSSPVNGSLFELWSGSGWYVFTYSCGGWQPGPNVPGSVLPVANPAQGVLVYTPCSAPTGLTLMINGPGVTAPGGGFLYTISVNNYGSTPTAAGPLTFTMGIPSAPTRQPVLTPPAGYATSDNVSYFTINVPALAGCSSTSLSFYVGCGTLQAGDAFTMSASLDGSTSPSLTVNCVSSLDPNCKTGPAGIGPHHYLTGNPTLPYSISFENEPTASAPAQRVVITDQLDPTTMQLASFQFGPITFGNQQVVPPAGENPFHYTVESYNVGGNTVNVQINATNDTDSFSPTYGKVTWAFQTIDPNTGLPPTSPLVGFLPPNSAPPTGQGMVTFTVNPLSSLVTGALVTNSASVIFDANNPIATQTWTNTMIATLPTLTISKAPAKQVQITWSGWTLQECGSLAGPWTNSPVQVSPWTFTPTVSPKFYRLAAP